MKKEILKSKMILIALSSILFVSCGGGGGGGGGASNLPVNPGTNPGTPSTPTTIEGTYPTVDTGLDKSNMSALKTNLYAAQRSSGASIPNGNSAVDGNGVRVAVLDSNFVDAVRSTVEDKNGKTTDDNSHPLVPRRDENLTNIYTDIEIISPSQPYIKDAISGTPISATKMEHGEEVLEVIGDLKYAPNNLAVTEGSTKKARNKIGLIVGSVGWDYQYTEGTSTKTRTGGIFPTQEIYDAAMARFGSQSVKIFNQSFGTEDAYDAPKYRSYKGEGYLPYAGFAKISSADASYKPMIPYFRDAIENKGGLFIWSAGNKANQNATVEAGLPYFDHRLEAGWISVVGVSTKKGSQYNVIDILSKAGSEAAYWSISAGQNGVEKVIINNSSQKVGQAGVGSSYAAPKVTRAAALVYDKFD